jgi:Zn-dependent protease/CBS domain-containing protein
MQGAFRLGKIAGIEIEIHISWLIILVLLTASLATGVFPQNAPGYSFAVYWIVGLVAAVLLFVSVLAHELGHSLVARARHLPVKSITLFIFGGVSNLEQEPRSAGTEFQVAVVGPLISLLIGAITYPLGQIVGPRTLVGAVLIYLGLTNFLLAAFNLIPGFPLDGGRVLRSILWAVTGSLRRATRIASIVGQIIAVLFILWGVVMFFNGNLLGGLWIGFIGWFLLSAAQAANSQSMLDSILRGVRVRDVMAPSTPSVPANISVQRLVDGYLLPLGLRVVPVVQADQFAGLVALADVRRVPREQWDLTPVGYIMVPLERLHVARPDQLLSDALALMTGQNINQLPVVQEDGRLVGMLTREAIMRYLDVRRGLGVPPAQRPPTPSESPSGPMPDSPAAS